MSKITPITREEMLLDGEDLTPITRKEKFIKRIYDKTQEIPEPITREEMFLKKAGEGSGGDVTIEQLNVTENGTYSEKGKAFSPVVVEVPQPTMTKLTATENGTYTAPSGTAYNEVEVDVSLPENAYLLEEYEDVPTDIASFTASDAPLKSLTVSIELVQAGSGEPSPENVRPISGWDEVNVSVSGVNVWDEEWEIGAYSVVNGTKITRNTAIRCKNLIPVVPNTTYYKKSPSPGIFWNIYYDANKNYLTYNSSAYNSELTTPTGAYYMAIYTEGGYGTTYNNDISINYPSTDTSYHAYNGQTYNIQFKDGDNPLTVYGGTLDVVSGVLTVDRVGVDLGTLDWDIDSQGLFVTQLPNDSQTYGYNSDLSNLMSDMWAPKVRDAGWAAMTDGQYGIATRQLRIKYSSVETTEAFATLVNGSIFVYELATPTTFYTQPTSIKSLDGDNNVSASTGEIETLEYFTKEA